MNRILSGVQPTGNLHLGNYLGAIQNWVKLQDSYDSLFGVMDLHAITVHQKSEDLQNSIYNTIATMIACGVDINKSCIFTQSSVSQHAELAWILGCHTPLGWLNRMTQFKEKTATNKDIAVLGLYSYPVLMASDILLYKATHVPVGDDQDQHVQLTRDIAGTFNRNYNQQYFTLPEAIMMENSSRIMSLRDGTKKMSKSDVSDYSRINLTDDADTIAQKIKKAKSDTIIGITFEDSRPESTNLLTIYAHLMGLTKDQAEYDCADKNFSEFKQMLTEVLIEHIGPISKEIAKLNADRNYLNNVLKDGNVKATQIASKTLKEVKDIVGFVEF